MISFRKLRKEEKQYKDYIMSGSLSLKHRHHHSDQCTKMSEHYKVINLIKSNGGGGWKTLSENEV